jgi:hypothetical protein
VFSTQGTCVDHVTGRGETCATSTTAAALRGAQPQRAGGAAQDLAAVVGANQPTGARRVGWVAMVQIEFLAPTSADTAFAELKRHDFLCGEEFLRRLETYAPYVRIITVGAGRGIARGDGAALALRLGKTTGVAVTLNLLINPGAAYRVLDVFLRFLAGDAALTRRDYGLQLVAFSAHRQHGITAADAAKLQLQDGDFSVTEGDASPAAGKAVTVPKGLVWEQTEAALFGLTYSDTTSASGAGVIAAFVSYYGGPTTTSESRGSTVTDGNTAWNFRSQWATFLAKLHMAVRMYDPTVDVTDPSEFPLPSWSTSTRLIGTRSSSHGNLTRPGGHLS